jgi:transposase
MEPTRTNKFTPDQEFLAVALELASGKWKMALHDGKRQNPTIKTVDAEEPEKRLGEVIAEMIKFKTKYGLPDGIRTVVLYEAGQDGFWIARRLIALGYEALVCDPASLLVQRHKKRAKTDRLDAIALVTALRAWLGGEVSRMRVVHMPSVEDEAARQLVRDRGELQKEAMQHRDRMRKLLRLEGCWDSVGADFAQRLASGKVRRHDGSALPAQMLGRLQRECERLAFVEQQFAELEANLVKQLPSTTQERIATLQRLCGVGKVGATRLVLELYWRKFRNRKQVAAAVGLTPQPYDSGDSRVDQGISKQGNRRVRALLIEMSWLWLRYQPNSAITRWFGDYTAGSKNKRNRRIAIVGVARRLSIAFWRYLEHGTMPVGAALKGDLADKAATMRMA